MIERDVQGVQGQSRKGAKATRKASRKGLAVGRYFTTKGVDPAEEMVWESRTASITG